MATAATRPGPGVGGHPLLAARWYAYYVLGLLTLCYVTNTVDRSQVLAASLQAIKREFQASDFALGLLSGLPFAIFYAVLGIPIAALADRWSRRNVLAIAVALWSAMTGLCGLAVNFAMLFAARIGTAVGEAGGTPPSHSLISDYFPKASRGTALSIYALAVPVGTSIGAALGGWGNQHLGWRLTFVLAGAPGLALAALAALTVIEPPRGHADGAAARRAAAPGLWESFWYLVKRPSFRHLGLAAAIHSAVWYASGTYNNAFLQRSHHMLVSQAGYWVSLFAAVGGVGTFLGGLLADRLSVRARDRRWYMWVPGIATFVQVPFQCLTYLSPNLAVALPAFAMMTLLAAVFFGPYFSVAQAVAPVRMRALASSLALFIQTLIGQGIGPPLAGRLSDRLAPAFGAHALGWSLVLVGLLNIWAAAHYLLGARTLRADLELTESLAA